MRLCPKCGKKSQEARCPEDGTATLVLAANPDSRLTSGTEINGRYRVLDMIGQGGFGAVYRATNIATDQDMAIKLLAASLDSDDSDMIQRFFAEAQVTASLKHPNTIRVFDFGQTEGGALYIAMELLSGLSLNELQKLRISEGKALTEEETINIGVQVLRSLAEAHLANLVHRDLKPHNIFLHEVEGDDPVVKVLDFGIAKRLGSNMTGTGKAFGTPSYMSPEQAQNKKIDRRSDLYSLGCVLYQCVAAQPPFDGDNPLAVLLSHVTDAPPDLRSESVVPVSEAFVRVIERALSKDPNGRFATAIEMRQALEAARGGEKAETLRSTMSVGSVRRGDAEVPALTEGYDVGEPARTAAYSPANTPVPGKTPARPTESASPDDATLAHWPVAPATPAKAEAAIVVQEPGAQTMAFLGLGAGATPADAAGAPGAADAENGGGAAASLASAPRRASLGIAIGVGVAVVLVSAALAVRYGGLGGRTGDGAGPLEAGPAGAPPGSATAPPTQVAGAGASDPAAGQGAATAVAGAGSLTGPGPTEGSAGATGIHSGAPGGAADPNGEVEVKVESTPPGAELRVGDRVVGNTPVTVKLTGNVRLGGTLTLPGYLPMPLTLSRSDAAMGANFVLAPATAAAKDPVRVARPARPTGQKPPPPPPTAPKPKTALEERL
ncbi:MAG: serine/threonine protein kinase [Myxococcales bacterium]|nr:serine/threonine protein kinase [Myxococcales bacterium]